MNNMDEHIEELFPFYAMGAVTDEEKAEVEAYVQADPAAQARLEAALTAADNLAFLAEPMTPAAPVKANVLAYARRRPRLSTAAAPSPAVASPPWWQRLRQSVAVPIFAGLATVTAILLFIWVLSLQTTISRLENQVAGLQPLETAVPELQSQVQILQRALEQQNEILDVVAAGNGLPVLGTEVQPEATGQLVVGPDGRTAVLFVSALPTLPSDQTYQLWLIGDEGPVSEGLFMVNEAGVGILEVEADVPVLSYTGVGVSVEPEGGSPQPTGAIVMHGDIVPSGVDS